MSVHTSFPQISSRFARFLCASREQVGPCSRSVCALLLMHQFQICVHQLPQCNASNYFFRASEHRCEGGCLRALHAAAARPQGPHPPACEVAVLVCSIDLSHVAIFFSDATAAGAAAARTLLRQGRICRRCLLYRQRLLTCKKFGQRCPRLRRPSGPAPPAHALSPSTPLPPPPCPPVCRFEMSRCVCPPWVEGCAREGCVGCATHPGRTEAPLSSPGLVGWSRRDMWQV